MSKSSDLSIILNDCQRSRKIECEKAFYLPAHPQVQRLTFRVVSQKLVNGRVSKLSFAFFSSDVYSFSV